MLSTLKNAWKVQDLRKRIIFTILMIAIFRLGNFIPVPGVNATNLQKISQGGTLLAFYDMMSGGAFSKFSIFAMSVTPYINASIIMQLLTIAIPRLEQLQKEGEVGRKKIQNYTRYSSVLLGAMQAFGTYALITQQAGVVVDTSKFNVFLIMLTLTTASTFLMWLGDQITEKGLGNGISLLIFINIISRLPQTIYQIVGLGYAGTVQITEIIVLIVVAVIMFVAVIVTSLAERRIPVQYAGKTQSGGTYRGQSTHIPINVNNSAVIAIIFAMAVMEFPQLILQFWPNSSLYKMVVTGKYSIFNSNTWQYCIVYFVAIVFFTWFYTEITFKPDEMAENIHKSAGFVPGIRPGEPTAKYLEKVIGKVSILGGVFAGCIAVFPVLLQSYTKFTNIYFGGTSMLIEVGVALETIKLLQSQLMMRHYEGFLK